MSKPLERLLIVQPPPLEYLPGLFLADTSSAAVGGDCARHATSERWRGRDVAFDPCTDGLTAPEKAAALVQAGWRHVAVAGAPADRVAVDILAGALEAAGIEVAPPAAAAAPGGKRGRRGAGLASRKTPLAPPPAGEAFVIVQPGRLLPPPWIVFEDTGDGRLVRRGPKLSGALPRWVETIRRVDAEDDIDMLSDVPGKLFAFEWMSAARRKRERQGVTARLARLIQRFGAERVLLRGSTHGPATAAAARDGASWAWRYGIDQPETRQLLIELCEECLPHHRHLLEAAIGYHEMCVDPLEEMYAGRGLIDRNAELIVNLVQ
jgi:hypothetical protein